MYDMAGITVFVLYDMRLIKQFNMSVGMLLFVLVRVRIGMPYVCVGGGGEGAAGTFSPILNR